MDKKMDKEKRDIKVQIRITPSEKLLIEKIRNIDKEMTVSRLFRESIYNYLKEHNETCIGTFKIG